MFPIRNFKNVRDALSQIDAAIDDFENNDLTISNEFALEDAIESCIQLKHRLEKILQKHQQLKKLVEVQAK